MRPVVTAVSALADDVMIQRGHANAVILTEGASMTPLDANTALTIGTQAASAGNLATSTHIDVNLTFALEAA